MTTSKRPGMGNYISCTRVSVISRRLAFTSFKPNRTDYLLPLKGSSLSIIWSSFSCSLMHFCAEYIFI